MWGRLFLSAVLVVLIIVWLVAIYLMIVDPRTVLQKWQRGLWSTDEIEAVNDLPQRPKLGPFSPALRFGGGASNQAGALSL
jgi:hypothetical protein